MVNELEELFTKDEEEKINWLISKVYDLTQEVNAIKENHLAHIDKDIKYLHTKLYIVTGAVVTILTGQNLLL